MSNYEEMARELNVVGDDLDPHRSRRVRVAAKIPLQQAIKQVAAQTGIPEHQIRQYAEEMQTKRAEFRTSPGTLLGPAVKAAADFEMAARRVAETMSQPVETVRKQMLEMATTSPRPAQDQQPANPADRRTFRILGRPKHYVQIGKHLRLEDGESPWT